MQKNSFDKRVIMEQEVKLLPYGVCDFETVIRQNLYYVDKTMYLSALEKQPRNVFFIRPRRFGKSIFLGMIHAYYDCKKKDQFQELFGNLWIGKHPTPLQGKYQVLHLDFSYVGGNIERLAENFNSYCCVKLDSFMDIYREFYGGNFISKVLASKDAGEKLNLINDESKKLGLHLYLIIDEYDNFTNTVLSEQGENVYWAITHANGFYRDVFKKFKGMFERIFITGVSPVTLDDVTSGFNIGWHISTKPEFNQMLGFSTEEVREMFAYYKNAGSIPAASDIEAMIDEMKPWYDNYCFSEDALRTQSKVFNCDMVIYYLRNYMDYGKAPAQMTDPNTKTDYSKMNQLLRLDQLDGDRKGIIRTIAETGQVVANLEESFPATELANPEIFPSLLFYYGMLTIKDTFGDMYVLGIPNNNVRKQYYEYLLRFFQDEKAVNLTQMKLMLTYMALEGKWREALEAMAKAYEDVSSVRDGIESERNLQGFFMAYLNMSNYYYTAPELELNHGYCDFFLLPNLTHYATKHSYILELKVLSKKDYEAKPKNGELSKVDEQWKDAEEQIKRYAKAPRVEALRQGTALHKIIMQFVAGKLVRMDEV